MKITLLLPLNVAYVLSIATHMMMNNNMLWYLEGNMFGFSKFRLVIITILITEMKTMT